MKKTLFILSIITMLAACDIDKVYINGDLDGMWQLQQVDSVGKTVNAQSVYYSFQRHMAQISKHYTEDIPLRFIANLNYEGNTITIYSMRRFLEEEKLPTEQELKMLFLPSDSVTFNINSLDSKQLIMSCGELMYTLRKW